MRHGRWRRACLSRAGSQYPEKGTESLQRATLVRNEMVCPVQPWKGSEWTFPVFSKAGVGGCENKWINYSGYRAVDSLQLLHPYRNFSLGRNSAGDTLPLEAPGRAKKLVSVSELQGPPSPSPCPSDLGRLCLLFCPLLSRNL